MILALRFLFFVVLGTMLWVTTWASLHCPLFSVPREVYTHPWFIATLVDAYWGFITFYVLVFYQQKAWHARLVWLVAILLLGNIAMALYCLAALFRVPLHASLGEVLAARRDGVSWLGLALALAGAAIVGAALLA
jgi:predicted permease